MQNERGRRVSHEGTFKSSQSLDVRVVEDVTDVNIGAVLIKTLVSQINQQKVKEWLRTKTETPLISHDFPSLPPRARILTTALFAMLLMFKLEQS